MWTYGGRVEPSLCRGGGAMLGSRARWSGKKSAGSSRKAPGRASRTPPPKAVGSYGLSSEAGRAFRTDPSVAAIHPVASAAQPESVHLRYGSQRVAFAENQSPEGRRGVRGYSACAVPSSSANGRSGLVSAVWLAHKSGAAQIRVSCPIHISSRQPVSHHRGRNIPEPECSEPPLATSE